MAASFYKAAVAGDEAWVDKLVAKGDNLEELSRVLHQVAGEGNESAVALLVRKGANLEVRDGSGCTPLLVAAQKGQANTLQKLVELGANVHAATPSGDTALHFVAANGKAPSALEMLKTLLPSNAAVDQYLLKPGSDGDTPLHLAALNGDHQIIQVMLGALGNDKSRSSGVDSKAQAARTPLHYAASKGKIQVVQLLMDFGASKQERDGYGSTPFHFAARFNGETELLEMLQLEDVDDPNSTTEMRTALHFAAGNGHNEVVKWLLAHGASPDLQDAIQGDTPLHWAARKGRASVVESLIVAGGANAQLLNKKGKLALGLADEGHHCEAAKAIVRAIRTSGKLPESLVSTRNNENGAALLHYFAGYGTSEELEWISFRQDVPASWDEQINTQDSNGRNAVHWAAMKGNKAALYILAENMKKGYLNAKGKFQETPLSLAFINGDIEFAEELLKWEPRDEDWMCDINSWMQDFLKSQQEKDPNLDQRIENLNATYEMQIKPSIVPYHVVVPLVFEIPPIYLALHISRKDIACFLQRHSTTKEGAVNQRGKNTGRTALHWATLLQDRDIVAHLCQMEEVFADAVDVLGKTALEYAKEMGLRFIEKELMRREDVIAYVKGLYRDRQVYLDAANAILVGAALIAGVTFAGWLQPPLNYVHYYDYKPDDHDGEYPSFAAVKQDIGVRMFWVFNSLSFSFAIASMIACLLGVVPDPHLYIASTVPCLDIASTVRHLRRALRSGAALLGLSIVFVLAAFGAAGFAVLPPKLKYRDNMMATMIVGGIPCVVLLAKFAWRLWLIRPRLVRALEQKIQVMKHPSLHKRELSRKHSSYSHVAQEVTDVAPLYQTVRPWDADGLDSLSPS